MNIPGNIEYYFNIAVDDEIPDSVLAEHNINPEAIMTNASRLRLNRDIYVSEEEEPC